MKAWNGSIASSLVIMPNTIASSRDAILTVACLCRGLGAGCNFARGGVGSEGPVNAVRSLPELPPLPLGPPGRHRETMWVGDSRYEYIDQNILKEEWAVMKDKAQTSDKTSTKSFRRHLGPIDHFWFEVESSGKPPLPAKCVVEALRHDLVIRNKFGPDVAEACGILPVAVASEAPQPLLRTLATFARQKGLLPLGALDAASLIPLGGSVSRYLAELRTPAELGASGGPGTGWIISLLADDPSMDGNHNLPSSAVGVVDSRPLRPRLNLCFYHRTTGVQLAFRPDTPRCFDFRRPLEEAPAATNQQNGSMPLLYNPNIDASDDTDAWRFHLSGRRTTTRAMPSRGQFLHAAAEHHVDPPTQLARGRYVFGGWSVDVIPDQFVCVILTPLAANEDPAQASPKLASKNLVADATTKPKLALTTSGTVTFTARHASAGLQPSKGRLLLQPEYQGQQVEREATVRGPRVSRDANGAIKYHLWS